MNVRAHATDPNSRANGPGVRFVVWLQGCTLACPGCFNPDTHGSAGGRELAVDDLARDFAAARVEGITLSGGEPMQQPAGALALLVAARGLGLSTLMFSGYTRAELAALPLGPEVLAHLDVLVDGRYVAGERHASGLRGSANQRIHLLTPRYTLADIEATPVAEIVIGTDGSLAFTGVDPVRIRQK